MSVTAPIYVPVPTRIAALRFAHGVDCFGLTEETDTDEGYPMYCLIVPDADGEIEAHEGDWVMQDLNTGRYHVCHDQMFRAMFTQEGIVQ